MAYLCLYILSPLAVAVSLFVTLIAGTEKTYYADFEHLNITYWNPKYYRFLNFSALRYSRRDPVHYVNFYYETLTALGNNVTVDVHIYEFLSNEYRPSFVEMHYKLCDLMLNDQIFGSALYEKMPEMYRHCPFPKGVYRVENISYPNMPVFSTFPFQKGRVFVNFSCPKIRERMVEGYVDLVIKSKWR